MCAYLAHQELLAQLRWNLQQMTPLSSVLPLLQSTRYTVEVQQGIFAVAVQSLLKLGPMKAYLRRFVKHVVEVADQQGFEINEDMLELVTTLPTTAPVHQESFHLRFSLQEHTNTFPPLAHSSARSHQETCMSQENPLPSQAESVVSGLDEEKVEDVNNVLVRVMWPMKEVGLVLWEAGMRLVEFLFLQQHLINGKKVLELGAGTGMTGLLLATFCSPCSVLLTDYEPRVIDNLQYNKDINESLGNIEKGIVKVSKLDWKDTARSVVETEEFDVVLCADCLYDPEVVPDLMASVQLLLRTNPTATVIFATTIRNAATFALFETEANQRGFKVREMEVPGDCPISFFSRKCAVMMNPTPDFNSIKIHRLYL